MEIACKTFDRIYENQTASGKFRTRWLRLKVVFDWKKIDGNAKNFAVVTKAPLEMELPFLMGSATIELNGSYFVRLFV